MSLEFVLLLFHSQARSHGMSGSTDCDDTIAHSYLFLSSLFAAVRGIIFAFVTSPLTVFDNPIDAIYALTSYSVVYFALFWLQLGLFVIAVLRLEFFFNPASKIWGDSFSAANVWNPGMFDDLESVTAAKVKLGQGNCSIHSN